MHNEIYVPISTCTFHMFCDTVIKSYIKSCDCLPFELGQINISICRNIACAYDNCHIDYNQLSWNVSHNGFSDADDKNIISNFSSNWFFLFFPLSIALLYIFGTMYQSCQECYWSLYIRIPALISLKNILSLIKHSTFPTILINTHLN